MAAESLFQDAFIYLGAAVVSVPVAKKLGLGSVLGYLLAGVFIGPFVLRLAGHQEDVMHFAEFGVVMMLFLIGMELKPALLWKMRGQVLGLGGLQVGITTAAFTVVGMVTNLPWQQSLAIGGILALSSTAIVMQTLNEKGLMRTHAGQSSFSILLFQDIAVIPMLALLPLLTIAAPELADVIPSESVDGSALGMQGWQRALLVTGTLTAIILLGIYAARPVFRIIAKTGMRELFVATCLLIFIGIELAMKAVGMSPALGAFLAGLVLSESEYRHEIENTIEPFKGLLLGVFFIAVGASINFSLIFSMPLLILSITAGLMVAKWLIIYGLSRLFRNTRAQSLTVAFYLAQGGEFAFVLFGFCQQNGILPDELVAILIAAVALSMLLTPLVLMAHEKYIQQRMISTVPEPDDKLRPAVENENNPVIVAGFGRFGQIVTRLITGSGYGATVLDHDPEQIELLRRFNDKVFYGDATRAELLESAGAAEAKLLIVAVDRPEEVLAIVDLAQKHFPHLKILARAADRRSAYELMRRDVPVVTRELFGSSMDMGIEALRLLGMRAYKAERQARMFRHVDEQHMVELADAWKDGANDEFVAKAKRKTELLKQVLSADILDSELQQDHAWEPVKPNVKTQGTIQPNDTE